MGPLNVTLVDLALLAGDGSDMVLQGILEDAEEEGSPIEYEVDGIPARFEDVYVLLVGVEGAVHELEKEGVWEGRVPYGEYAWPVKVIKRA